MNHLFVVVLSVAFIISLWLMLKPKVKPAKNVPVYIPETNVFNMVVISRSIEISPELLMISPLARTRAQQELEYGIGQDIRDSIIFEEERRDYGERFFLTGRIFIGKKK